MVIKTMKNDKLGQMKIQQMIFMVLAVGLLFLLVGLIFLSVAFRNLKATAANIAEKDSMLLVSKLANSPEFSCGNAFGTSRVNCVDFDKLMALKGNIEKYTSFWGVAKIEVRKIVPINEIDCQEENYPECGTVKILNLQVDTLPSSSAFISLCRKEVNESRTYNKCELARLIVASEDKT